MRFGRVAMSVCLADRAYRPRAVCPRSVRHKPAFGRNSIRMSWPLRRPFSATPNSSGAGTVKDFTLITQNVDGLHQRAGSDNVIEFHGNIFEDRCFVEDCVVEDASDVSSAVPACPACGGQLRPGVVWFGEAIPEDALNKAMAAASTCDLFFSIGTSSLVWPAAGLAETARAAGARIVEVNPNPTPLSDMSDFCLSGNAGTLLPELVSRLLASELRA